MTIATNETRITFCNKQIAHILTSSLMLVTNSNQQKREPRSSLARALCEDMKNREDMIFRHGRAYQRKTGFNATLARKFYYSFHFKNHHKYHANCFFENKYHTQNLIFNNCITPLSLLLFCWFTNNVHLHSWISKPSCCVLLF